MANTLDLKPAKSCRLCHKNVEGHLVGTDYTCRSCQHECRRAEPLLRDFAVLLTALQRDNALALKSMREELAELKTTLSNRQQKASSSVRGIKDDLASLKAQVDALEVQPSSFRDKLERIEQGLEAIRADLTRLERAETQKTRHHAAELDQAKWEGAVAGEEVKQAVEGLEDFTRRLKDAFVALAGPEVSKKEQEEKERERERERRELEEGVNELKGFMLQMQTAFSMLPRNQPEKPKPNGTAEGTPKRK